MSSISTLSLHAPLLQSIQQAQSSLSQAQIELSTGAPADLGLTLGASTGQSLSLQNEADTLNGFTATNAYATTRLSTTSNALTTMLSSAQEISASLVTAASAGGSTDILQGTASNALQTLISSLNTSVGGQFIFGGINTTTAPVSNYSSTPASAAEQAVENAFQQAFGISPGDPSASSISGPAMQSFLDNQFSALFSDSQWQTNWSSASSQTIQSTISTAQATTTSVSANAGAFQNIAQAYAMLTEFTGANMSADAKAAVVSTAQKLLNTGISGLTDAQSSVGVAQSTIDAANTQNSAQVSVLQNSLSDLRSVDPYALSTTVTTLQTQLEASYSLTSQLQQLSLVNYLSGN